ncbi:hypothetical protein MAPG_03422 [Magnaporthiopsis poae ATCC 64411]|uniref:Enoyl reductase (ER) domain-containing protein n=1 Tax=Magnaporthiopsis poae (strain ATCC 64411 / 73-15) TaxID=644358 RepID=A0A0C4DTZ1_MAGP6|nr:hypothetical protein MAPG_03422 [Magnaporthiopsis poae ATCC 64411]
MSSDTARVRRWQTVQDGLDQMYLTDGPMPTPGEGEVLVETRAVSINYRDTEVANGIYKSHHKSLASTTPSPIAPCSDMCGVVVGLGPSSSPWRLGDRVVSTFLPGFAAGQVREHHLATSLGFPADGVLQTHRVFSAGGAGEAAALGLKKKTVLVQGTGGVSICGLQIAKASGATVIVTSSSDAKLQRAKALGADHGINYKTTPEWQDEVLWLTGGRGADIIFECGGAETLHRSLQCVSFGGLVSCIGYLSGTHERVDATAASRPHVNLLTLTRNSTIKGILNGPQDRFVEMNAFLAEKDVKPLVERVFSLEEGKEAMLYLASGSHFGKVVVKMS